MAGAELCQSKKDKMTTSVTPEIKETTATAHAEESSLGVKKRGGTTP